MTTQKRRRFAAWWLLLAVFGCGPEVKIVSPADGEVVTDSSFVTRVTFSAPARTFEIVLDGSDVSHGFFVTNDQAAGLVSGVTTGEHVLSVYYLSDSGFEDTDQVIFSVSVPVSLDSISASPLTLSLTAGATANLTVTGHLSDDSTQDLTSDASTVFASSDTSIVTVAAGGAVTAVAPGSATIGIAHDGLSTTVPVTVAAAAG